MKEVIPMREFTRQCKGRIRWSYLVAGGLLAIVGGS